MDMNEFPSMGRVSWPLQEAVVQILDSTLQALEHGMGEKMPTGNMGPLCSVGVLAELKEPAQTSAFCSLF